MPSSRLFVQRGSIREADDGTLLCQDSIHCLPPRFGADEVEQGIAVLLKFHCSVLDSRLVLQLEFDAGLRYWLIRWLASGSKARLRGLR